MLTKEEEIDVAKILYTARGEKEEFKRGTSYHICLDDIIILCTKLKEVNKECSEIHERIKEYDALLHKTLYPTLYKKGT